MFEINVCSLIMLVAFFVLCIAGVAVLVLMYYCCRVAFKVTKLLERVSTVLTFFILAVILVVIGFGGFYAVKHIVVNC